MLSDMFPAPPTVSWIQRTWLVTVALATEALASAVLMKIDRLQAGIPRRADRRMLERLHRVMLAKVHEMRRCNAIEEEGLPVVHQSSTGVSNAEVVLSRSDPAWSMEAQHEAEALRGVLEPEIEVHHIGSTAVPGLSAKPIIDFAIELPSTRFSAALKEAKAALGHLGYRFIGMRGGLFFEKGPAPIRTHALQIHVAGSVVLTMLLDFRNALERDDELRRDYAATKAAIARCLPRHRWIYAIYKGHWIQEQQWRGVGANGWAERYVGHRQSQTQLLRLVRGAD